MKYNKLMTVLLAASVLAACGDKEEPKQPEEQPVEEQQVAVDVKQQAESFKEYAQAQMDDFVADTERLASLVKEGKLEDAQKLYPLVTMYYERLQPLTANFTELDKKINGPLIDGKEEEITGFHRLAQGLFINKNTSGYDVVVDQLVADVKQLQQDFESLDVSQTNVLASAVSMFDQMVNERLTTTSNANNEVYAVKAQTEVAEELVKIFMQRVSTESAATATEKIAALNEVVAYYEVGKEDYVNYSFFTAKQKEELKTAVVDVQNALQAMNESLK